jgi:hypothetical protein
MSLLDGVREKLTSATMRAIDKSMLADIQNNIYAARQFIFDQAASRTVGRFIRNCPDILADNLEFAIPPYDPCYIEIDIDALYSEMRKIGDIRPQAQTDYKAGFLFVKNRVYVLVNERDDPSPFIAIFGTYFKNGPTPPNAVIENEKIEKKSLQIQLTGSTYNHLTGEQRQRFMDTFGVFHCAQSIALMSDKLESHLEGARGEARTLAAILLMLYNKKHVKLTDHPAERRMVRGKSRPYMAHTTVEISLTDPVEIRRAFGSGHGSPKRRHEVRTHYAHKRIAMRCEHEWVKLETEENERWECSKCGGLRFLRREHLRGDGAIGFVTKKYVVKP